MSVRTPPATGEVEEAQNQSNGSDRKHNAAVDDDDSSGLTQQRKSGKTHGQQFPIMETENPHRPGMKREN